MRRLISGIMCFFMLLSLMMIPPVSAGAAVESVENTDILPLADEEGSEEPGDTAEPEEFPKNGSVTGDNVRVRKGPGTSYDVAYKLNKNDPVIIHKVEYADDLEWGRLADGNWIALMYVVFESNPEDFRKIVNKIDAELFGLFSAENF